MDLEAICTGLSSTLKGSADTEQCLETLHNAENLQIPLELACPWPPCLAELLQNLLIKRSRISNEAISAYISRLTALEKKWDRCRVAAVGHWWSKMLVPNGTHFPVSTPPEILHQILTSHVPDTHGDPKKNWREQVDFMCSCALVAKTWNGPATEILYQGCIRLDDSKSITKLSQTLSHDKGTLPAVHHLVLTAGYLDTEFPQVTVQLLENCPHLQVLQLVGRSLKFPPFFGSFSHLTAVQLRTVNLRQFALLLSQSPNLCHLRLEQVKNFSGRQQAVMLGADPPGDSLDDIPTPVYRLKQLHLRSTMLTSTQVTWLLAATEQLEVVSLNGVYAPSLPGAIEALVHSLQLEGASPHPMIDQVADGLPAFTALESLQLSGEGWSLKPLLLSVTAPLKGLQILQSLSGVKALVDVLKDIFWQPHLTEITVSVEAATDTDVDSQVHTLRECCIARDIKLQCVPMEHIAFTGNPFVAI
ncbi:hypothetical protein C8R46DRAFT_1062396 [Mycena filopes]|nr:hypothetical protein C8R46DRAFT_1062396 [Mycena filopes]